MPEVATGPEAAVEAAPAGAPAAPPPAQQATPAPAPSAPAAPDDDFVRLQKAQIADWNGDTHALIREAKTYRHVENSGGLDLLQHLQSQGVEPAALKDALGNIAGDMPLGDVLRLLTSPPDSAPNAPATPPAPAAPNGAGPTPEEIAEAAAAAAVEKYRAEERQRQEQNQQQAEQQQRAQAEKAASQFWDQAFDELKLPADTPQRRVAQALSADATRRAIAEALQRDEPLLTPAQAMARAGEYLPGPEDLARAKELVVADWKDLHNEAVSAAAAGQAGMPAGTLGSGAGGPQPPPGTDGYMTEEQVAQATMKAIREAG